MSADSDFTGHYGRGGLLARLNAALSADGADPEHPTAEALAPYDQFHGRGIEATQELAALMPAGPSDHLLDIGSGIGGPARYLAQRFGCHVTGIDLTAEFCEVARHLTALLRLQDCVAFEVGNALEMPFAADAFDGAYSMNVSMNIEDKPRLYREVLRILKPGAWLVLSEIARGEGGELDYPMPWAASREQSFLATSDETRKGLVDAGFDVVQCRSMRAENLAFAARSRALVERGERPPHRAVMLVNAEFASAAMTNFARALFKACIDPIEVLARRPT